LKNNIIIGRYINKMDYETRIAEFYFLLHRGNLESLEFILFDLLRTLKYDISSLCRDTHHETKGNQTVVHYLRLLYGLIGHTRDIYCGKGERDLSYMMIVTWYKFFPVLAIFALHTFVFSITPLKNSNYPYGCWNDIKYFSKYILRTYTSHPLLDIIISYANRQLKQDIQCESHTDTSNVSNISNVSKWIPREPKMKQLYEKFVCDWFDIETRPTQKYMSFLKKQYRQIVSQQYSKLDKYSTNKTIFKEIMKGSLSNKIERPLLPNIGRNYFHENMFVGDYVKCAIAINKEYNGDFEKISIDLNAEWLNRKWCWIIATFHKCYGGIPIVDISRDISDENLYHAIGFACLIAIKSGIMRILLVSDIPIWINISESSHLCSIVDSVWTHCENRRSSRFQPTFSLLLESTIHSKLSVLDNIKLFIFSEKFQFHWQTIIKQFECKMNIIFWNIGGEPKIPAQDFYAEDHRELILMSGANVALLNAFCNVEILSFNGPFFFISQLINCARYKPLYDYFDIFYSNLHR